MKTLTKLISLIFPGAGQRVGQTLRLRVQLASFFTVGGFGVSQALRLLSNLILTRLVVPEAFGLMAVAISINIWAVMLTDIGIGSSVIRSKSSDDVDFIHTAWGMQLVRNTLVWILIIIAAVTVHILAGQHVFAEHSIYMNAALPWVMAAAGLQVLIIGFSSINRALAQRKLAMGRVIALEVATQLCSMVVTIGFAIAGFGVWALVIGMIASALVSTVASHVIFPGPAMRFRFYRRHAGEIFSFGKWLIVASFFGFLVNRGDQILFGGYMASERFSLYAIAAMWIAAAAAVLQTVVSRIFYPAFSEIIRDRPDDLTGAYKKSRLLIDMASIGLAFGAFFLAEPVFNLIYSETYAGVGYFVKLLSPFLLLTPFRLINTVVLAGGDSKNFTAVTVLAGAAMLVLTPVAFSLFGEKTAIVTFALIEVVSLPIIWRIGAKWLRIDPVVEARTLGAIVLLVALIFTIG